MAQPTIRVLLTEDVAADAELEVRELKRAGLRIEHRIVDAEESFERALREFSPDVILSDFSMPDFDGMAALALARELAPDTPFIFVSGTIGEEYAIRALKNGATDYVVKSNLVRLPAAVERAISEARERREKRRAEIELEIARERLTSIFQSLPDMLWSVDLHTDQIIYVSPAARAIFGREPEVFLNDPDLWLEVVHAEDRQLVRAAWDGLKRGEPFDLDYRTVHPDGTQRWVNDRARMVNGADGAPERIDGVVRDITERVEQDRKLVRLQRIREVIGALNAAIVRIRDREALFQEFCRIAVAQGGFVLSRIIEIDRDGKARVAAHTDPDARTFQGMVDAYNRDPAGAKSLFALAARSGKQVISDDIANDPRVPNRAELTREGNYALALLPAVVDGRTACIVVLRAREAGFFDQEEVRLLTEMVSNIAFALELMEKQDRITYLALFDPLTELPNRTLFQERLTQAVDVARRGDSKLGLALLDVERFKAINDTFGQHGGDEALKEFARRLHHMARDDSHVGRLGGNLFAVTFHDVTDAAQLGRAMESAERRFLSQPLDIDGRELRLTAKAGIAIFPDDGGDADALLRNAEATLKKAKETGERYVFYAPQMNAQVAEMVELELRLREAVERGEFFLHFQPKLDLASRRVVGLEALLRWNGPKGVQMSPARFVPVLEQTGLILEAGRQALAAANAAYRGWQAQGLNPPRIAVNVSAIQLRRPSFVADVRAAIGDLGNDGGGVDLEVTESLLMADIESSIRKLHELRGAGLHIALDDFGTGFSSLSYLSKLPIDTLKIDRSFIHGMTERADDTSIVSTIISLAQALRLKVVAEGVETEQQAQLLRLLRCDQAQGYLFSPPLPAEKIEALLKSL
jgi:diguanylate cyclase (GGDEF)-like protein/PAS domain S-box-containing protein